MVWLVEVFGYFTVRSVMTYVVEVGLESVHYSVLGLANILNATSLARQAVYDI